METANQVKLQYFNWADTISFTSCWLSVKDDSGVDLWPPFPMRYPSMDGISLHSLHRNIMVSNEMLTQGMSCSLEDGDVQWKTLPRGEECCFHELKCCTWKWVIMAGLILCLYMKPKLHPEAVQPPQEIGFLQQLNSAASLFLMKCLDKADLK